MVKMVYRDKVTWDQINRANANRDEFSPLHMFTCSREEFSLEMLQKLRSEICLTRTPGARPRVYMCGLGNDAMEAQIKEVLGIEITKTMEMDSMVKALMMILKRLPRRDLCHPADDSRLSHTTLQESTPDLFPCMLLNLSSTFGYNLLHRDGSLKLTSLREWRSVFYGSVLCAVRYQIP